MHPCSPSNLNPEILIWEVSFSRREAHVWRFSGHSTDPNPGLYVYWMPDALSAQNKTPGGSTWPGAGQPLWPHLLPHLPFSGWLNKPQPHGLSFLFLQRSSWFSSAPPLLADSSSISQVLHETRGIIELSLKALAGNVALGQKMKNPPSCEKALQKDY